MNLFDLNNMKKFTDLSGNIVYSAGTDLLTFYEERLYWLQIISRGNNPTVTYASCAHTLNTDIDIIREVIEQMAKLDASTLIENVNILSKSDSVAVVLLVEKQSLNNGFHHEYVFGMLFKEWMYV